MQRVEGALEEVGLEKTALVKRGELRPGSPNRELEPELEGDRRSDESGPHKEGWTEPTRGRSHLFAPLGLRRGSVQVAPTQVRRFERLEQIQDGCDVSCDEGGFGQRNRERHWEQQQRR